MRILFYTLLLVMSHNIKAQNQEIIDNIWFLENLLIDSIELPPPSNSDFSYIDADFSSTSLITEVCSASNAIISNFDNTSFQIDEFAFIGFDCTLQKSIDYDSLYFFDFFEIDIPNTIYNYEITDGVNNTRVLILTNRNGDKAFYGNELLETNDIDLTRIVLYTNPANNELTVSLLNTESATVSIYNILGSSVMNETINSKTQNLNIETLNAGIYLMNIVLSDGRKQIVKFIKE